MTADHCGRGPVVRSVNVGMGENGMHTNFPVGMSLFVV
jgi:hypothetical protein